jgi:branched-chain amino acid transport system ATP-binding protein
VLEINDAVLRFGGVTRVYAHSRNSPRLLGAAVSWPAGRAARRRLEAEAAWLLRELDLTDVAHHPAQGLPFGTLKRVELARALKTDGELIAIGAK